MRRIVLIVAVALATLAWTYWADWDNTAIEQPIEFPHKTHIALNLPCASCHQRVEKDTVAGRPPTALCVACHASAESKSEEIKKLKAYGERGEEIPWQRVWRLPRHVFFSHRVHVAIAKLDCQSCHGPMETLERPPPRPLKTLAMGDCIECHLKSMSAARVTNMTHSTEVRIRRLVNDCNACHR